MFKRSGNFLAFAIISFLSAPVLAFNFTVTPGAGACDPQSDCDPTSNCSTCQNPASPATPCSFQEALNIAQCNQEDDTLNMAAGNYDSSVIASATTGCGLKGFCYVGDRGSTQENRSLTILGAGAGQTIIDGKTQLGVIGLRIAGMGNNDTGLTLTIRDITIQDNLSNSFGAGLVAQLDDANGVLEQNEFIGNDTAGGGGGVGLSANGNGGYTLNRNAFIDNKCYGGGGGMFISIRDGAVVLTNNILAGNIVTTTGDGAGVHFEAIGNATFSVVNNTLFNNQIQMDGNGAGLGFQLCNAANADVYNNIIFGNSVNTGTGADIFAGELIFCGTTPSGALNLFNNDFSDFDQDSSGFTVNGFPGATNLNTDPLWVNSGADDFHLTAQSPVIDKGDLNPPSGLPTPDFDGLTRPQGALPDMDALEFPVTPSPTPIATATPTPSPTPSSALLSGAGCSLGSGNEAMPFFRCMLLGSLALALTRLSKRRIPS